VATPIKGKRFFNLSKKKVLLRVRRIFKFISLSLIKAFLAPQKINNFSLNELETEIHKIPQLSENEIDMLTAGFTKKEACETIKQTNKQSSSSQMGFQLSFI
jgi:hypothetical protein